LPAAHPNVLCRKHKHAETGNFGELGPYPRDDTLGAQSAAVAERLQADKHTAEIDSGIESRSTARRAETGNSRVGKHYIHRLELQSLHGVKRNIRRCDRAAEAKAGVVLREVAFRRLDVEADGEHDRCDEYDQHE